MKTEVLEKELTAAKNAVSRNPSDASLQLELGIAYFELERLDEAMAAFRRAQAIDPAMAVAHNWLGRIYERTGQAEQAIVEYRRAIELDRQCINAFFGLGLTYLWHVGDNEAAVEALQDGLEHNPENALLQTTLGTAYAFMGRFDDAIGALRVGIQLDPDNAFAYGWLGLISLHLEKYDDVVMVCKREIGIEDTNDARRLLGYAYETRGADAEAILEFERAIALDPQDYEARAAVAKIYRTVGRNAEANEQYAIARKMASDDDDYGQACFEAVSGNSDYALRLLAIAVEGKRAKKNWARLDPEFASLKDHPKFVELTA